WDTNWMRLQLWYLAVRA
ncbi:branched-chain amino acid transport system / permease component family protein, partial [Vibrio parahaemolyticus AQ3810]